MKLTTLEKVTNFKNVKVIEILLGAIDTHHYPIISGGLSYKRGF